MKYVLTPIALFSFYGKIFRSGNYGMLFPRSGILSGSPQNV
jgi:hypothetical protein